LLKLRCMGPLYYGDNLDNCVILAP
jgi:hypothetical protein